MIRTVVHYSSVNDCAPWIKVLSGEQLYTFYPREFDRDIRMGIDVEFIPGKNKYTIINYFY
ncbi:hypothetical protein AB8U03_14750 [Clostridium sp. Mt-5]|uniref:Uncharacterized protein n=1 Tax=Clostridium moutaii TaxID=3240932 RepID=A0ABV4BX79_9CLOT